MLGGDPGLVVSSVDVSINTLQTQKGVCVCVGGEGGYDIDKKAQTPGSCLYGLLT